VDLVIDITAGLDRFADTLKRLDPHKTAKACPSLKSLAAIDRVSMDRVSLAEMISQSVAIMTSHYR
jgi:hypothetical protein